MRACVVVIPAAVSLMAPAAAMPGTVVTSSSTEADRNSASRSDLSCDDAFSVNSRLAMVLDWWGAYVRYSLVGLKERWCDR